MTIHFDRWRCLFRRRVRLSALSVVAGLLATLALAPNALATGASGSNASNYGAGGQLSVNGRTGALTFAAALFRIPGIVSGMDAELTLTFRSDDAQSDVENKISYFGLPYGWSFGLSYIYNDGEKVRINVNGQQTYVLSGSWYSSFTPAGGNQSYSAKTGMLQYNLMDANLRSASQGTTVNGHPVRYIFSTLEGGVQYFTSSGLLLRRADRFGNHIDYTYDNMDGNPTEVALTGITDTWGSTISIGPCTGENCAPGQMTVTLPDNRTVSWVAPNDYTVSEIIDPQGKVTHVGWTNSQCAHGQNLISSLTNPAGGMSAVTWGCLNVCSEAPGNGSCATENNVTTWPVVTQMVQCPNNASGQPCPDGSANNDYETTVYAYGTENNEQNYTGYPLYSPYAPSDPNADTLMSSNDTSYVYTTVTGTQRANTETINQVESDYNFVHVLQERRMFVRARQSNGNWGMSLSKEVSYCYSLPSKSEDMDECAMDATNYKDLPANYQSPTRIGSCQYNVGENANTDEGRHSLVTMAYDSFGHTTNKRTYHGTATQGTTSCGDRGIRLSVGNLQLVNDQYMAYDTPGEKDLDSDQYLTLGPGASHFGLALGQQSFIYLDPDESEPGVHGGLTEITGPVLVKLLCNTLTTDQGQETTGTNIKTTTVGLMATDAPEPTALGVIGPCNDPGQSKPWVVTVAPPKASTFTYDAHGRSTSHATNWGSDYTAPNGYTRPAGVNQTKHTTSYSLTTAAAGEEACGTATASTVLQITSTNYADPANQQGTTAAQKRRVCTLNGWEVSSTVPYDPTKGGKNVPTTYYTHQVDGLIKSTVHPNRSSVSTEYYYTCPTAQNGHTATCPSTSTAKSKCPYDTTLNRSCVVHTLNAGAGNTSYVDGVIGVTVKDGLGRVVASLDNTGGGVTGSGFDKLQTHTTVTFDDRGLATTRTNQIGASAPLVYKSTVEYGPKLRPALVCDARGTAHQFVHDDVLQQTKKVINGSDKESYTLNDGRKLTLLASCELTAGQTTKGTGVCPTVAAASSSVNCSGDAYMSYTLHDGSGVPHSVTASAGTQMNELASVKSVTGQSTITDGNTTISAFSADLLQYGYTFTSKANESSGAVTANSSWQRNLIGHRRKHQLSVTANATTTRVGSDLFSFNALSEQVSELNRMSTNEVTLQKSLAYTPTGKLDNFTSYAGVTFNNYYDSMQRLVRHCYPGDKGGSQGENLTHDPITGQVLKVSRFTNPNACSADGAGDVEGVYQTYAYNRFGGLKSISYSDGTKLQWAFDQYQRPSCFADAMATAAGKSCPASPTADDFVPSADTMLIYHQYFADTDPYRRGELQRSCRGVSDGSGEHVTKCVEMDYYTPESTGGMCSGGAIGTDGSCTKGASSIVGAFAGMAMSETYCNGGPCDDGGKTVYTTTHLYDSHRRPASVVTKNDAGKIIMASTYVYDQYNNLVTETSSSQLDTSNDSNYQVAYGYDGLLRLISAKREDLEGNLIRSQTYEYDASSNLSKKVEVTPDETK